jgi:hypothetical protein
METIAEIGIYEYINRRFPHLIKSNKILYYKRMIRDKICFALHVEWLHTCPHVFMDKFNYECQMDGLEKTVCSYYSRESEEFIQAKISYLQSDAYQLHRYTETRSLQRSSHYTPEEDITQYGIYFYINYYTPGGINQKIKKFCELIASDRYLQCHCTALFRNTHEDDYVICNEPDLETTELPNLVYTYTNKNIYRFMDMSVHREPTYDILPLDM